MTFNRLSAMCNTCIIIKIWGTMTYEFQSILQDVSKLLTKSNDLTKSVHLRYQ